MVSGPREEHINSCPFALLSPLVEIMFGPPLPCRALGIVLTFPSVMAPLVTTINMDENTTESTTEMSI